MKGVVLHGNTELFFSELIDSAVSNQSLSIQEETRVYLLNLLSNNAKSPNIIKQSKARSYDNKPLSLLYLEALNERITTKRVMLKFIGDYALYISGYFADSFNGKIIDQGNYIVLGSNAFGNLSRIAISSGSSDLYLDIFERFSELVDILTEVSFDTMISSSEDLIKLYDRWLRTKSKILERKLIEKGIITNQGLMIA